MNLKITLLIICWVVGSCFADKQQRVLPSLPEITVPKTAEPPLIDGVVEENEWAGAAVIASLKPHLFGKSEVYPTKVKLLWDTNYLYVAFECIDDDVICSGTMKHDDPLYKEDVCEVFLDAVGDGKQYIEIQVNPDGVNFDQMFFVTTNNPAVTATGRIHPDVTRRDLWKSIEWDMEGLQTAGKRIYEGQQLKLWSVEMAIPAADVMKRRGTQKFFPTDIRANFMRYKHEIEGNKDVINHMNWSPVQHGCPHISPARMGIIKLVE